jgi:hypothetical protein
MRIGVLTSAAVVTLTGCSPMEADPKDKAWAVQAPEQCHAVAGRVRAALARGGIANRNLEELSGAIRTIKASPVVGQKYAVPFETLTTVHEGPT